MEWTSDVLSFKIMEQNDFHINYLRTKGMLLSQMKLKEQFFIICTLFHDILISFQFVKIFSPNVV